MSLRRAHKDKRARKHVGQLAVLLVAPFLCLLYAMWVLGSGPFAVILIPTIALIFAWQEYRRRERRSARAQAEAQDGLRPLTVAEQNEFRKYFAERALIYAVILDRAGSEQYLRTKVLPEGIEVTTRRVHLELLKSRGVWDKMAQEDREALIMPDGEWHPEWIDNLLVGYEPLRLMRWMLRVDHFLPVVGKQLQFDWKMVHEIVRDPDKLHQGKGLVDLKTMETARAAAAQFYARCLAEQIHRGDAEPKDEESAKWAADLSERLKSRQSEDLVLGTKLVSEVSGEELGWATMLSRRRLGFFQWAKRAMESGVPPEPPYGFEA